jgi:hypothetical protein
MSDPCDAPTQYDEWIFLCGHANIKKFHRGGPRMKRQIERPITDVVVTENLIGSQT